MRAIRRRASAFVLPAILLILALPIPSIARHFDQADRIVVGNTAGTLSVLLDVADHRVLVGSGPTRSHAADFVGRSTRPWNRHIDLLIIPGTDATHVPGALGLLERGDVSGVAVVGVPGDEAVWTLLEREAAGDDVQIRYFEAAQSLELTPTSSLLMTTFDSDDELGTLVRFEYRGARVDIVGSSSSQSDAVPLPADVPANNDHIVIEMRGRSVGLGFDPSLLIRPQPFTPGEFSDESDRFVAEIRRNDRLTIQLENDEIRVPIDQLQVPGNANAEK